MNVFGILSRNQSARENAEATIKNYKGKQGIVVITDAGLIETRCSPCGVKVCTLGWDRTENVTRVGNVPTDPVMGGPAPDFGTFICHLWKPPTLLSHMRQALNRLFR